MNQISYRIKKQYQICFPHNYAKIKFDSDGNFSLEETLALHSVIILMSVFNEDKNNYYCIYS